MNEQKILFFLIALLFFTACLFTLEEYGINWDTVNHLPRGQAYLHYLLTGRQDYSDLSSFENYFQDPKKLAPSTSQTRSFYQSNAADFTWFMQYDGNGHPPLSDIFSSIFNRVLYGNLHLINDIDSYRVYGIFLATILVGLVGYWVSSLYGGFAGIVSSFVLATYPLFWSESHFNTEKDIPETTFWSLFLFSFWKGVTTKKAKWILISGIFFGLALGTKFNILFALFIVIPWLAVYFFVKSRQFNKIKILKLGLTFISALLVGVAIFVGSWPYLWPDPISRIQTVVGYYKTIGLTTNVDPRFLGHLGINTYPSQWIAFTTQPIALVFFILGIFYLIYLIAKKKDLNALLFLLWFTVPIARVSYPGTTVYGGIRQIMEYIPAMAIIAGIGANFIFLKLKNSFLQTVYFLGIAISLVVPIIKYHPNENVYFNFLIGGLKGAKAAELPSWGNSFGAAYRQGVIWINNNAPANSVVVTAYELTPNIPKIWFRPDLILDNKQRSGPLNKGEYAITLTYQGTEVRSYYDSYLERFLDPVYEVKADDIAILKVWKNDKEHFKNGLNSEIEVKSFEVNKEKEGFRLDFGKDYRLTKVQSNFNNSNCKPLSYAYIEVSLDGKVWKRMPGTMPKEDWNTSAFGEQPQSNFFIAPIAAEKVQHLRFVISPVDACLSKIYNLRVFAIKEE